MDNINGIQINFIYKFVNSRKVFLTTASTGTYYKKLSKIVFGKADPTSDRLDNMEAYNNTFIVFQQAYNSIDRKRGVTILYELEYWQNSYTLIVMPMKNTKLYIQWNLVITSLKRPNK